MSDRVKREPQVPGDRLSRTAKLFGREAMEKLKESRVLLFGVGGVGGGCAEALVRGGIGTIGMVDPDDVDITNVNRQMFAATENVGRLKLDAAEDRLRAIAPEGVVIRKYPVFYLPETKDQVDFSEYDYVVDACDTVAAKIQIVMEAKELGIPVISSMGAGFRIDPTQFQVADIYKTEMDPLAKVMRREMKKRRVRHLKVVYSKEKPMRLIPELEDAPGSPGSVSFVPTVCGMILAGEVIKDLTEGLRPEA